MNRSLITGVLLCVFLAGCAATRKKDTQMEELRSHVSSLESELERKDEKIKSFESTVERADSAPMNRGYVTAAAPVKEEKTKGVSKLSAKQIQTALKNAGFYKGPLDGKLGRQTRKALKAFQRAQGLKPDGMAGKRTLLRLGKYL